MWEVQYPKDNVCGLDGTSLATRIDDARQRERIQGWILPLNLQSEFELRNKRTISVLVGDRMKVSFQKKKGSAEICKFVISPRQKRNLSVLLLQSINQSFSSLTDTPAVM